MKIQTKTVATLLLFALLNGCSMIPEYLQPEPPIAKSLKSPQIEEPEAGQNDLQVANPASVGWREVFTDPDLQFLIQTALKNNRNLKQTALNLEIYQAQHQIQRSFLFPQVSADGYGMKQRTLGGASNITTEAYSLKLATTAWELDFFGRIQSLKEQALENYLAMEESLKSTHISLIADVVTSYLTLLADRELLQISEDTKKLEEESYALVEQRVNAGVADQMDLAQARTSLEAVNVNLPLYKRRVAQDIHLLSLLTGSSLPAKIFDHKKLLSDVKPMAVIPASLSSDILLQRPDILAAEHQLKGANANIGAARAAFFPRINLTAGLGIISGELSSLFDDSGSYSFMPSISLPIFTAGRLRAALDVAEIQKEVNIARYEYAIQNAFKEVSDALIAFETYDEQLASQKANLDANQLYYNHAKNRYEEGVDSFLTLLIAQRSLYAVKQSYLTMQLSNMINKVHLYKVLGGGWHETSVQ